MLTKIGDIVENVLFDASTSSMPAPAGLPAVSDNGNVIQLKLCPLATYEADRTLSSVPPLSWHRRSRYRRSPACDERVASVGSLRKGELEIEAMRPEHCQYDPDVWLTVEQIAAKQHMLVQLTQKTFLRAMGRKNPGSSNRSIGSARTRCRVRPRMSTWAA